MSQLKKIALLILGCNLVSFSALALNITNTDVQTIIDQGSRPFTGRILINDNQQTYVDLTQGDGINADSRFLIGSISKTITATLVLRAVDQQKISVNDDITDYLNIVTEHPITIAQLLIPIPLIIWSFSGNSVSSRQVIGLKT